MIHMYGFSNALDPKIGFHQRIRIMLKEVLVEVDMHRVRHGATGKLMLCAFAVSQFPDTKKSCLSRVLFLSVSL
ncbi:hypothetical protein MKW92_023308, partial [Papaver armeniacum]